MTVKEALRSIRALGLTANRTPDNEFRVNLPRPYGTEATAYYTSDAEDAVGAAMEMAQHLDTWGC